MEGVCTLGGICGWCCCDPWRGVVIKPGLLWRIEHVFTVKDGEPTELYLALMRLGRGLFHLAAIVCAVVAVL